MSDKINVLILGGGGREHALAWKISQSNLLGKLFITPGNGGTAAYASTVNLNISDFGGIGQFCLAADVNIIVVGPEDPLVKGIQDFFEQQESYQHIFVFGPSRTAAQLEGSKDFSKQFMQKYNIPTAKYQTFKSGEEAEAHLFLSTMNAPFVLKADGLAAGKGVLIIDDLEEAKKSVSEMLGGMFGAASAKVVIEEFLDGIEVSYFALCDGESYVLLPEAKDYKRIGEGDTGLNTGGMGAVSPVYFADDNFTDLVESTIVAPTIEGLKKEGIPYTGFLFFGLIKVNGKPMVIEYNCRMGDPETEVVLPRVKSDLLAAIVLAKDKKIKSYQLAINEYFASTVIAVSAGYPGNYKKGEVIDLPKTLQEKSILFHAGTSVEHNNTITAGGRVFACTGLGDTLQEALQNSYQLIDQLNYSGKTFRKDIGKDLLKFSNEQ